MAEIRIVRGACALLVALSALLLAAHFLRAGETGLVVVSLLSPALLYVGRVWAVRVLQFLLLAGALEWLVTAVEVHEVRASVGEPWFRMALIVGAVVVFTVFSAVALQLILPRGGQGEERRGTPVAVPFAAFLVTAVLLGVVQVNLDLQALLLERFWESGGWFELFALSLYAAFLSEQMLNVHESTKWRLRAWRLFSVVFFAQLLLGLAGLDRFLMTGELHLPVPALIVAGPLYRGEGLFMPILFVSTVLLVGPAWCSYLCYIGSWDSVGAGRRKRPGTMPEWRRSAHVGMLALVIVVALALRWAGVPGLWAVAVGAAFGLGGVVVMSVWSRGTGVMAHCTTYCPIGVVATWLGRVNPFRIRVGEGCTDCGACTPACRYDALSREDVRRRAPGSSCTLCGDCVGRCREGHLAYRFPGLTSAASRGLFVVLVVALHASFLGVARI